MLKVRLSRPIRRWRMRFLKPARENWRALLRFYRLAVAKHRRLGIYAGAAMAVAVTLALPAPLLTMYLIDTVIPQQNISLLMLVSGAVLLVLVVRTAASFVQQVYFSKLKARALFDLRTKVLERLQSLPLSFHQKNHSAYLASRVSTDCERTTQGLLADSMLSFVREGLTFVVGAAVLFYLHPKLTGLICVLLPFYVFSVVRANRLIRDSTFEALESSATCSKTLQETLAGVYTVKAFAAERRELIRNVGALKIALRTGRRTELISAAASLVSSFIGAVGPVLVLAYGGLEIMRGNLTIGELVAFSAYIGYLFGPVDSLVTLNIIMQGSLTALSRVLELLDEPTDAGSPAVAKPRPVRGRIEFENVFYGYSAAKPILKGVHLHIEPNETVALVGPSGAGKTTLLNLLLRFWTPDEGRILIDGTDLRRFDARDLRRQFAVVPQEHMLFSGTVADNLRLAKPSASDEELVRAAEMANAHDFILALEKGYDTLIGERGAGLSVGQKQRLCIARAVLKHPKVLILDEATSSVDPESERLIQQALQTVMKGRTSLVVGHRLSTVRIADRAYRVAEDGSVRELGKADLAASFLDAAPAA